MYVSKTVGYKNYMHAEGHQDHKEISNHQKLRYKHGQKNIKGVINNEIENGLARDVGLHSHRMTKI